MIDYSDNPVDAPLQKCSECGYEINQDYDRYEYKASGDIICDECTNSHFDSAVRVYEYVGPGEAVGVLDYAYGLDKTREVNNYDEYEGAPECIESAAWEASSAWRGYVNVKFKKGFTSIAGGWSTDRYDDVKWKWNFNDFVEQVCEGNLEPPVPVWFVFAQTSNIFSTAADIVTRNKDEKVFLKWLAQETGMTRQQLEEALK